MKRHMLVALIICATSVFLPSMTFCEEVVVTEESECNCGYRDIIEDFGGNTEEFVNTTIGRLCIAFVICLPVFSDWLFIILVFILVTVIIVKCTAIVYKYKARITEKESDE
jgi:hypothetical protein